MPFVTRCWPEDPVYCVDDGHTYERSAIERYFAENKSTLRTPLGMPIQTGKLIHNYAIKYGVTVCPIGKCEIKDPVIVEQDGKTYDKESLMRAFSETIFVGLPLRLSNGYHTHLDLYRNEAFIEFRNSSNRPRLKEYPKEIDLDTPTISTLKLNEMMDIWIINGSGPVPHRIDVIKEMERFRNQQPNIPNRKVHCGKNWVSKTITENNSNNGITIYTDCTFFNCEIKGFSSNTWIFKCVFRHCKFIDCDFISAQVKESFMVSCKYINTVGLDRQEITWIE